MPESYVIDQFPGGGREAEVYLVHERATGIERTAKFFFPDRNVNNRAARFYAGKLHRLRKCPVISVPCTGNHTIQENPISVLISKYCAGELLAADLSKQRGKRLSPFWALHPLHALAAGVESIPAAGEVSWRLTYW